MEKIANLLGVSTSFWSQYFSNRPLCGRWWCKTSVFISYCRSRWFNCTNPMKLSAFTSPLSTSCTGEQLFNPLTDGCWFSFISPFAIFSKSINDFIISFGVFSLFMSDWLPLTSQRIDCLPCLCSVFTFNFISNQVN